jgi:hypothetical protein
MLVSFMLSHTKLISGFGILKGVAVAITLATLDIVFWKALIIAVVSGLIGAAGAIIAAIIATREVTRQRKQIADVQRAVNADRRVSDPSPSDEA